MSNSHATVTIITHRSSTEWRRRRRHINASAITFSAQTATTGLSSGSIIQLPRMTRGR